GVFYYKEVDLSKIHGIMFPKIGDYKPSDIEFVAAWDVDARKVGKDLSEAIFSPPNCTTIF
ncbi:MAG TPA: inositol-3-phosphate synthase, partial [Thermodesulfobacterium commune]|nr:inositol-3-phosphate synthase [Thermodesulfobacterium commune]